MTGLEEIKGTVAPPEGICPGSTRRSYFCRNGSGGSGDQTWSIPLWKRVVWPETTLYRDDQARIRAGYSRGSAHGRSMRMAIFCALVTEAIG